MKNKRLLSLFLSIVLLSACPVGLFDITSSAETATSGTTGDCTWTLDGTALTIGGNGSMASYSSSDVAPWGTAITEVIINNGVTGIDNAT